MPITKAFLQSQLAVLQQVHPHAGDFCFFTDTDNLRPILSSGMLLCRNQAQQTVGIKRDCASSSVNGNAPGWVHEERHAPSLAPPCRLHGTIDCFASGNSIGASI